MPLFPNTTQPRIPSVNDSGERSRRSDLPDFDDIDQLKEELAQACEDYRQSGISYAHKKHAYHKAKAKAYLQSPGKNTDERSAKAFAFYEAEMLEADIAEAERDAAQELVRSLRQMLSAVQTKVAASKAVANAIHYGQFNG
jgi:Lon protease-like protein